MLRTIHISYLLPLIILCEGFVSIAIEILTIRQLLPVAGGSVVVTSLIIGFFLLFLALGYRRGGKVTHHLQQKLKTNFFIASVWFGIGLSFIFIEVFFIAIQKISGPHIVYPLLAYLLLIIAPLIYILGQTVPITMNMVKQTATAGRIGGDTLGLSTLGSFLGALFTTLVLMYFLGVAWTVLIVYLMLIFIVLLLAETRASFALNLLFACAITFVIYKFNIETEKSYFVLTNNYANYQINGTREKSLYINDGLSSRLDEKNHALRYAEIIKRIIFDDLKLRAANILVLGAGGFSLTAENTHENTFTYVDIDPQIDTVAIPRFVKRRNSPLILDDARHYLQSTNNQYDVIVSDTYSDIRTIPTHLLTKEFMHAIQNRLTKNGIVIFNIVANPMLSDPYSKRIDNTIRSVFANCMAIPVVYANASSNILYVCHNNLRDDKQIYTDNFNNSTTDSFIW